MADDKHDPSEFPLEIGAPARNALQAHGYRFLDQLTEVSAAELLALHGVGPKAVRILGERLADRGQGFAKH